MKALVVDDSRATRVILKRILSQVGFEELHEAANGQEAVALLDTLGEVDVALVDWNMPVMNGYELVRTVRSKARWDGLRLMMVTSENEADRIVAALELGADEYLMKPFGAEDVRDKLALLGMEVSR